MSDELSAKIAKLPTWARDHIRRLELRAEPAIEEMVKLRRETEIAKQIAQRFRESNEALFEILKCAGKGGSELAKVITSTLESYEIFQQQEKE